MDTLYYRAVYETPGGRQAEVFVAGDMDDARTYATGPNARGRRLLSLREYADQTDAMTAEDDTQE
jgi:hypothetical protein